MKWIPLRTVFDHRSWFWFPAIYFVRLRQTGRIVYVGLTRHVIQRFITSKSNSRWFKSARIEDFEVAFEQPTMDLLADERRENELIRQLQHEFNIRGKQ